MMNILSLQDLPSLFALGVDDVSPADKDPATCTACSYTCSHTLSE